MTSKHLGVVVETRFLLLVRSHTCRRRHRSRMQDFSLHVRSPRRFLQIQLARVARIQVVLWHKNNIEIVIHENNSYN